MKTSEVFKKTFGSLSETVKEVRCHHFLTLLCCGCRSTDRKTVRLLWLIMLFSQLSQKVILGCNFQLFSFSINLSILFWLTVLCWHVDHRVSRRWVVPTSGRRSRKVWRAQRGRPCTPPSPSPKVEKNWAERVHSRPSLRSAETT